MLFKDKHLQSSATNTTDFCRRIKQRHASIPACTLLALRACIYACVSNDAIETQVVRAAPPLMCVLGNYCCDEGRLAQFPSPLRPPFFSLPVFMKKACTGVLPPRGGTVVPVSITALSMINVLSLAGPVRIQVPLRATMDFTSSPSRSLIIYGCNQLKHCSALFPLTTRFRYP